MTPLVKHAIRHPFWTLKKVYLYGRSCISLGKDDVVLALFPKTGSTWVRFFLFNLLNIVERSGREATIDEMNETMPEFGHPSLFRDWPFKTIPRVVKTHQPRNYPLSRHPTILVVRDPRDVVVSFYHYANAKKEIGYRGGIKDLIHHRDMGFKAFFDQYNSWRDQADLILRYEDLKADPYKEFKRLVGYLKIPANDNQIREAIARSSMVNMREAQSQSEAFKKKFDDDFVFARSGESNQWKEFFDEQDLVLWENMKRENRFTLYE